VKFRLKVCLLLIASLCLTTLASGLPQQDTKDETSKTGEKKRGKKGSGKGIINPGEEGGTAATADRSRYSRGALGGPPPPEGATASSEQVPSDEQMPSERSSSAKKSAKKKASKAPPAPK
jgi:hypothetical protein